MDPETTSTSAEIVDTAGLLDLTEPTPEEAHREAVRAVRAVLRRLDATDDEYDDALAALVELAKERD